MEVTPNRENLNLVSANPWPDVKKNVAVISIRVFFNELSNDARRVSIANQWTELEEVKRPPPEVRRGQPPPPSRAWKSRCPSARSELNPQSLCRKHWEKWTKDKTNAQRCWKFFVQHSPTSVLCHSIVYCEFFLFKLTSIPYHVERSKLQTYDNRIRSIVHHYSLHE